MRVNFSVTNQLASPSIHAAALANRPAAGQPGRVFIDTDNPSTGIYRDTGTVWLQIAQNGGGGETLQTVTTAGNTTNLNLVLTYEDSTVSNALVFYNEDQAQEEYVVLKRQTGITTNDCLVIQSRGNISPSTNPAGIMIDGANDVIKTFYTTAYTEKGLKLDFANTQYEIGDAGSNAIRINTSSMAAYIFTNNYTNWYCSGATTEIGDTQSQGNSTKFVVDDSSQYIKTFYSGSDIGLKLDFANFLYSFGDNDLQSVIDINQGLYNIFFNTNQSAFRLEGVGTALIGDVDNNANGTSLLINDTNQTIKTKNQGNDIGFNVDFGSQSTIFGDYNNVINLTKLEVNYGSGTIITADTNGIYGLNIDFNSKYFSLGDYVGNVNGTYILINDNNQELELSSNLLSATAGGSSGQHLKIKVGGTDYKIALLNP